MEEFNDEPLSKEAYEKLAAIYESFKQQWSKEIKVNIDGSNSPSQQTQGAFVLAINGELRQEGVREGRKGWSDTAEYEGLVFALEQLIAADVTPNDRIEIYSDSRFLVKQMNGDWKVNYTKGYSNLYKEARYLIREHGLNITFHWIPREENQQADALSHGLEAGEEAEGFDVEYREVCQ